MKELTVEEIHRKNIGKVSDKWASYLPFYTHLFKEFRTQKINLLEIGVQNGGSLETWKSFFVEANLLIGCDIDNRCGNLQYDDPRVKIIVGDVNHLHTFTKIKNLCGTFKIIIDDGSHLSGDILKSFLLYFSLVEPGGLYVIEDTHTLYNPAYGGSILNESSAYNFFKKLIDVLNAQFWSNEISVDMYLKDFLTGDQRFAFLKEGWIESIEFRNSIIVIRKSSSASIDKLGERVITGSIASVNKKVLDVKT